MLCAFSVLNSELIKNLTHNLENSDQKKEMTNGFAHNMVHQIISLFKLDNFDQMQKQELQSKLIKINWKCYNCCDCQSKKRTKNLLLTLPADLFGVMGFLPSIIASGEVGV